MTLELLVDAPDFWRRLAGDIRDARTRVFVQTLSFEGDDAGLGLAAALLERPELDRRVLVDSFTRHFINDHFIHAPRNARNVELQAEVRRTRQMLADMACRGVGVRFTNPTGPLLTRLPARNHKKLIVVDDEIAYIGGINFSDHNFAWHDVMLRIESPQLARFLSADFLATWNGRPQRSSMTVPGLELHCLDGRTNELAVGRLFEAIHGAAHSITVLSPYVSFPFCAPLRAAAKRGVHVTVVSPAANNRDFLRRYIACESARSGFDLRYYDGPMSHLKAMLIDERSLVLGSSNFDYLSARVQGEIFAIITEPALVRDFTTRVLEPDLRRSRRAAAPRRGLRGHLLEAQMRIAGALAVAVARIGTPLNIAL